MKDVMRHCLLAMVMLVVSAFSVACSDDDETRLDTNSMRGVWYTDGEGEHYAVAMVLEQDSVIVCFYQKNDLILLAHTPYRVENEELVADINRVGVGTIRMKVEKLTNTEMEVKLRGTVPGLNENGVYHTTMLRTLAIPNLQNSSMFEGIWKQSGKEVNSVDDLLDYTGYIAGFTNANRCWHLTAAQGSLVRFIPFRSYHFDGKHIVFTTLTGKEIYKINFFFKNHYVAIESRVNGYLPAGTELAYDYVSDSFDDVIWEENDGDNKTVHVMNTLIHSYYEINSGTIEIFRNSIWVPSKINHETGEIEQFYTKAFNALETENISENRVIDKSLKSAVGTTATWVRKDMLTGSEQIHEVKRTLDYPRQQMDFTGRWVAAEKNTPFESFELKADRTMTVKLTGVGEVKGMLYSADQEGMVIVDQNGRFLMQFLIVYYNRNQRAVLYTGEDFITVDFAK